MRKGPQKPSYTTASEVPQSLRSLCCMHQVFGMAFQRPPRFTHPPNPPINFTSSVLALSSPSFLLLQLGSVAHSPLLVPPARTDLHWKSASCLKIMKMRSAGCLRLICIAVAGLRAPLSRFLEGAPYTFLNE